jgi:hypothetical protein
MSKIFRTKELSLATFLWSKGIKYLGPEQVTPEFYYFTFDEPDRCEELKKEFYLIKGKLYKSMDYEKTN